MSHFRQVRTRMKRLDALCNVLKARGYHPISMAGDEHVAVDECTSLVLSAAEIKFGNHWPIRFVKDGDVIVTECDTDVFNTGWAKEAYNVNHAGEGVTTDFEKVLLPEYAVEATLLTMAEQGFTCDRSNIKVDGDIITLIGTKDTSTTFRPAVMAASSNIVVI